MYWYVQFDCWRDMFRFMAERLLPFTRSNESLGVIDSVSECFSTRVVKLRLVGHVDVLLGLLEGFTNYGMGAI